MAIKYSNIPIHPRDLEEIASTVINIGDATQAMNLAANSELWHYRNIDVYHGKAGVLKYKGIEVVLFYRCEEIHTPYSEVDPETVFKEASRWIRVDLLPGKRLESALTQKSKSEINLSSQEKTTYLFQLQQRQDLIDKHEDTIKALQLTVTEKQSIFEANFKRQKTVYENHFAKYIKDLWEELLPIYDAFNQLDGTLKLCLISMFKKLAVKCNVDLIAPEPGTRFDPTLHHAVSLDEAVEADVIVKLGTVGYSYAGKVVMAASVIVGGKHE